MKDFDASRAERADRVQGFKIGGEEFRVQPGVHPTVLSSYEDAVLTGRGDLHEAMDEVVKAFLWDDDSRTRWDKLRGRKKDPVTVGDLRGIIGYLYEVEAELPTIAPEPSSPGRARTRQRSEAASSSPAGAAT